jgi:hypothetical protein
MATANNVYSLEGNKPMTVADLMSILKKIPVKKRNALVNMFSDQEGNHVRGLFEVEIEINNKEVNLIPHHDEISFDN